MTTITHGRLRILEFPGVPSPPEDPFTAMLSRSLHGVVIRRAVDREIIAHCARQLDSGALPGPRVDDVNVGGQPLTATDPSLSGYQEAARRFRDATIPPGHPGGLEDAIRRGLASICGHRAVEPAVAHGGMLAPCALVTLGPGVELPVHLEELYFQTDSAFATVVPTLGIDVVFTFSVLVEAPATGGCLQLFDRFTGELGPDRSYAAIARAAADLTPLTLDLEPGDLAFFDGLTVVHGVTAPEGARRISCIGHAGANGDTVRYFI